MQAFLYKVAQHLHSTYGDNISKLCLVLPNKRGALFLKQHLAKVYNKTIWLPHIVAAEEFITELSGINVADNITLTTELYKSYKIVLGEKVEPFESFVKWGSIMLHDFNEVDRYIINAKDMFRNLRDIKVIENWSLAEQHELSDFQKNYVNFMYVMGDIYEVYTKQLLAQHICYQGMSYRLAVENLKKSELINKYHKFVFCGFNALNKAEEIIFTELAKDQKADILWDIDNYYFDDKLQEAGKFLRKHFTKPLLSGKNFISDDLKESSKSIEIIGVPKNMAQAAAASQKLSELIHKGARPDSMSVVLADESLLFPVLSALPKEVDAVNVTLEFPLRLTSIYDFVEQLLNLHINRSKTSGVQSAFYYKDLVRLFYNPYFNRLLNSNTLVQRVVKRIVEHNISYFTYDSLKRYFENHFEKIEFLFRDWSSIHNALSSIETLFERLRITLLSTKKTNNELILETEFLFEFTKIITRIKDIVNGVDFINDIRSFRILLQQLVATASVPFFGEPLKGLQVMGVLETRTLDFETVVLLSVNENILPSGKTNNSFIPFDLKKFFGLPIYADKDAVYAYHFYRILQRAKNVVIIYNTESDQFGNGEKSRFITQVINELGEANKNINIKEYILSGQLQNNKSGNEIIIKKDEAIISKLIDKATNPDRSGFSPSSLNSFKDCSLRFYFQYGAEIKETEEIEENIEANTMGTILHEVLEKIYSPFIGRVLNANEHKGLNKLIEEKTNEAFKKHFSQTEISQGKNLLAVNVVKMYAEKLLQLDETYIAELEKRKQALSIKALEEKLNAELQINVNGHPQNIRISGTCDRIDFTPEYFRIVDYKSSVTYGKDKFEFSGFEELFSKPEYNKLLQLFIYAWLAWKNNLSSPEKLLPCIIPFRSEKGQAYYITENKKNLAFTTDLLHEFEQQLGIFISEIFNKKQDFTQTEKIETCTFCTYSSICNR